METKEELPQTSPKTSPKTTIKSKSPITHKKTIKKKIKLKLVERTQDITAKTKTPEKSPITPIFKNKETIQPCIEEIEKKEELNVKRKELNEKKKECEEELYTYIFKFFNSNETLEDLLVSLFNLYKERKKKDITFKITFREFIMLFPRDTTLSGYNFKRQHVFEQMCRLMLLFNYDNNYFGNNKEFYSSLEEYSKGVTRKLSKEDILKLKINDGSAAQSVDIFFKIPLSKKKIIESSEQLCGKTKNTFVEEKKEDPKDLYVLIQNKFYDKEKSSADKYDVTKIAHRAKLLTSERFNNSTYKIVLMVNSKQLLDDKIKRNRNDDFGLVSDIFGLDEIEGWFQNMLYDLYNSTTIDDFIKREIKDKPTLQLRFHQELIVNSSNAYLNLEGEKSRKKFIWGCVPRSGKSYMVAGMVDKRKHLDNDVLIILGAKSETETQFIEMFEYYDNFKEYGIVTTHKDLIEERRKGKHKFIFLLSQEKIKINKQENFTDKFKEDYSALFEKKHIDLYFDEIHKGGSTETSQNKLIQSLLDNKIRIDMFIMVTATYARPTIAYEQLVTAYPPVILNWSYNDQQDMKELTNVDKLNSFKLSRNNDIEREVIENLLDEYKIRFGDDYLNSIEDYYKKYPELVIINPFIDIETQNEKLFNLHGNVFKLSCSAIGKTIEEIKEPSSIFEDNNAVIDLLQFIARIDEDNTLSDNCIYGKLKYNYNYDVVNKLHSQLWFLPYSNLYTNAQQCKFDKKITSNVSGYENDKDEDGGLPNIEPLTRGLVLNLLKIPFYKNNFCFLVVHNQKIYDFYTNTVSNKDIYTKDDCVRYTETEKKMSVKDIIKGFELEAYKKNKSLIILTGSMLRLGISLPCVDLAFNFDNIKSIDLNYQTMFRVVTERENKKYGYYLDFYPERATQFLYQYNEVYGGGFKKSKNMDELVIQLQSLLYLFNYNGISIRRIDEKQTLKLYNTLIEKLKLTKNDYSNRYVKEGSDTIKKLLLAQTNKEIIDKLKNLRFKKDKSGKKKSTKEIVKPGVDKDRAVLRQGDDEDKKDLDKEEDEEMISIEEISSLLHTFVSLVALFSDQKNYNCNTLIECFENIVSDLSKLEDFQDFCNCNSEHIDVLGCYLKRTQDYTLDNYKKSIQVVIDIINNPKNSELTNSLIIIFENIREAIGMKENLIYSMDIKNIQDKIEEYLPVRQAEKDKYGEVFTPMSLIEEMMDKLPKSVWKNPDLKWLDPANGIGNFPMVIFMRLNEGLKDVDGFKNEKKRKEHIIKNMLYMVELNEKNVAVSRKIFGKEANIYCGSFLEDGWKTAFGIDKFDVIVGNPPWNKPQEGTRKGSYGGRTLWDKFVINSFEVLNISGYVGFIHPSNWRGLGELHSLWDIMTQKQILYLRIYGEKDGQKLFNVGSRFDVYVLQNKENTRHTLVIDELGEKHLLKLNEMPFLPNYAYREINKILTTEDKGIDVIYSSSIYDTRKLKENKTSEYKYPVVHSITQDGIKFWYANDNTKGQFGVPKVILNFNRHQYSHPEQNDYEGKYGMSQISFGIPIKSKREGDLILKAVETPIFKKIIASTKWGAFQTDYRMFKYFRPDWYNILLKENKQTRKRSYSLPAQRKTRKIKVGSIPSTSKSKKNKLSYTAGSKKKKYTKKK